MSGKALPRSIVRRLFGVSASVIDALDRRPGVAHQRHPQRVAGRRWRRSRPAGRCGALSATRGLAVGDRPRGAGGVGRQRGVPLVPGRVARPPHRSLDDDGDAVGRRDRHRHRCRRPAPDRPARPGSSGAPAPARRSRAAPAAAPNGSWNVTWIRAGVVDGLATWTKVSKNVPVAPSAMNQLCPSAVTPVPSMPAVHSSLPRLRYIARSTMIGVPLLLWNSPATSAASRPGTASALIVRRCCGADGVVAGHRRAGADGTAQEARVDLGRLVARVLHQVEQIEARRASRPRRNTS